MANYNSSWGEGETVFLRNPGVGGRQYLAQPPQRVETEIPVPDGIHRRHSRPHAPAPHDFTSHRSSTFPVRRERAFVGLPTEHKPHRREGNWIQRHFTWPFSLTATRNKYKPDAPLFTWHERQANARAEREAAFQAQEEAALWRERDMAILREQRDATIGDVDVDQETFFQARRRTLDLAKWETSIREKEALLRSERKAAQKERDILLREGKEAVAKEREAYLRKRERAVLREKEAFLRAEREAGGARESWTGEGPGGSLRPPHATSSQRHEGRDIIVRDYEEHRRETRYQAYAEDAVDRDMGRASRESDAIRRAETRPVSVRRSHERGS